MKRAIAVAVRPAGSSETNKSGGTIPPTTARRYAVLYYKRTGKVHKNKGVTRSDGILTVMPPPTCNVTLTDAEEHVSDTEEDDDDDDDDEPCKKKKKKSFRAKSKKKKRASSVICSGINWSVAKRAFGIVANENDASTVNQVPQEFQLGCNLLQEDEIVILSQYECQIVEVLGNTKNQAMSKPSPHPAAKSQTLKKSTMGLQSRTLVSRPVGGNFLSRQPPNRQPQQLNPTPTGRIPPRQPGAVIRNRLSNRGGGIGSRIPPPQPNQKSIAYTNDHDSESDSQVETTKSTVRKTTAASKNILGTQKRKVVCGRGLGRSSNKCSSKPANATDPFPGAIGQIIAPPSVRVSLRPHQREGITFLWNCLTGASPALQAVAQRSGAGDAATRGAVLADEMGLGKTLMTITTVFALHRRNKENRFIVVCPSSLVSNWAKEFDKWLGKASQPKRVVIRKGGDEGLKLIRAFVPVKPQKSEVLIISYELFRMHVSILSKSKNIGLLAVDEGHRLKNTSGSLTLTALESLECESRLLLTGTPIQNNLTEFWNVVNFVCPNILGSLTSFRSEFERPLSAANNKQATYEQKVKGNESSRALEAITSTFMLRRLQKDVLKSLLPPKQTILLFCRPSMCQSDIYKRLTAGWSDRSGSTNSSGSTGALSLLTKVRKLCSHPHLLEDGLISSSVDLDTSIAASGKLSVLEKLLASIRACNPEDKVVIVSNFTSVLSLIEQTILAKHQWSSLRLDGTTELSTRQTLVDSFNRGSVDQSFVFLLSSKAGGCGLNLIGANRLVMFDADWNPASDNQAMARVYRQGQTKPCFIYRMFTSGTVDEVILQRQMQKGSLATLAHGAGSGKDRGSGFTKEEIRDCFTLKDGCDCDTKQKLGNKWSDYDGMDSLNTEGCTDEPLLTISGECANTLRFVHLVKEDDEGVDIKDVDEIGDDEECRVSEDNSSEGSSEEECEFDD
eukprot:scaffold49244_cov52-Attheya_sp.AAC.8